MPWWACACILVALLGACTSLRIDQDRITKEGGADWIGHVVVADKKGGFDRSVLTDRVFENGKSPLGDDYPCKIEKQDEPVFAYCHIKFVVNQLIKEIKNKQKLDPLENKLKLVIFIHGGLNTPESSLRRVQEQTPIIMSDGYYPIFLNWHSEFGDTYFDEIRNVREGRRRDLGTEEWYNVALTIASTPFQFLADVIRGMGQAVPLWANQISLVYENFTADYAQKLLDLEEAQNNYAERGGKKYIIIDKAGVKRTTAMKSLDRALAVATVLSKALTVPAVSSIGLRSWQNQLRRVEAVMRRPTEFVLPSKSKNSKTYEPPHDESTSEKVLPCTPNLPNGKIGVLPTKNDVLPNKNELLKYGTGVFAVFMTTLTNALEQDCEGMIEITLVGHSMGAMIANNIIEVFPKFDFDNIVYLGAAASLRSVNDIVLNYLKMRNYESNRENGGYPKKTTKFYNLTLHPVHDKFQQNQGGLTPRGSILEWIDAFYEYSNSDLDRTAGKLTNVERVVPIFDELLFDWKLKDNVKIRVFGLETKGPVKRRTGGPTNHREFSSIVVGERENVQDLIYPVTFKYWLPMFWRKNYGEIDRCRGRNRQLFVKRGEDPDGRPFFEPVGARELPERFLPAPANCKASRLDDG